MRCGDGGVDAPRVTRRDSQLHLENVLRQPASRKFGPAIAAVGGTVKTAICADKRSVLPWSFLPLPHARKNNVRVLRIDLHLGRSSAVIREQYAFEGLTA